MFVGVGLVWSGSVSYGVGCLVVSGLGVCVWVGCAWCMLFECVLVGVGARWIVLLCVIARVVFGVVCSVWVYSVRCVLACCSCCVCCSVWVCVVRVVCACLVCCVCRGRVVWVCARYGWPRVVVLLCLVGG